MIPTGPARRMWVKEIWNKLRHSVDFIRRLQSVADAG